jgi:hypothetical protein
MLHDDNVRVAKKAGANAIDVKLEISRDMFHVFRLPSSLYPKGREGSTASPNSFSR